MYLPWANELTVKDIGKLTDIKPKFIQRIHYVMFGIRDAALHHSQRAVIGVRRSGVDYHYLVSLWYYYHCLIYHGE